MDAFADRHVAIALLCVGMAIPVALFLLAALAADYVEEMKRDAHRKKKWWQK
jgi:hypothetical protein